MRHVARPHLRGPVVALLLVAALAFTARSEGVVFCTTTDYGVSGSFSTVGLSSPWAVAAGLGSAHSDAVAKCHGGYVYVVNRLYADNIQVLDPANGFSTVLQFSVGPGSGPQDIAFTDDGRAYVSRYESEWLYEVDASTGAIVDSVDLSLFADGDGLPEMSRMIMADGLLFVAIQRLDRDYFWLPAAPSYLAVVDPTTNELVDADGDSPGVQGVALTGTNPYSEMLYDDSLGLIYVGEAGHWGVPDGGIEAVDVSSLEAIGFVATESDLGGDIRDFTRPLEGAAFAVVSVADPEWESYCVSFDWVTGAATGTVWRPGGYVVEDIELDEGSRQLFLSDRTYEEPGVRVFDASGVQLTSGVLDVGLPPSDLEIVNPVWTGIEDASGAPRARLAAAPNPSAGATTLSFYAPTACPLTLDVFDVAGRRVRGIDAGAVASGAGAVRWDGRDAAGRPVSSGVYFARIRGDSWSANGKIVVVRGDGQGR